MPKKRIEPAVKELIRKMPSELTCQKISELTGISVATISRIRRNIDWNISSFAAIIVDRIMLKSPYYEDGDAKTKNISIRQIFLCREHGFSSGQQTYCFWMGYSLECCQNAFMPQRFGIPWYSCPKCDFKKRIPHTCKSRFCSSCGKWQQTDGRDFFEPAA